MANKVGVKGPDMTFMY